MRLKCMGLTAFFGIKNNNLKNDCINHTDNQNCFHMTIQSIILHSTNPLFFITTAMSYNPISIFQHCPGRWCSMSNSTVQCSSTATTSLYVLSRIYCLFQKCTTAHTLQNAAFIDDFFVVVHFPLMHSHKSALHSWTTNVSKQKRT